MSKEHKVIIAPGMDGRTDKIERATSNWSEKYDLQPIMFPITWKDNEPFEPKLRRITDLIDLLAGKGDLISLVGCSAGGPAMVNAFIERKDKINKVVNNGGFLRPGNRKGNRSFETRSAASLAFREAVFRFDQLESSLTPKDREKILTVRPWFDELVPPETVVIQGALNCQIPMVEHVLGLGLALVKYDPVIMFLKGEKG